MKKKFVAGVATLGIAGTMALSGCGPANASSTYCVDNMGHVLNPSYCTPGGYGYSPSFFYLMGTFHGHSYHNGMIIPRNYVNGSRKIIPTDRAARARAGLPSSGSIRSGYTPRVSTPAKPQTSVKAPTKSGSFTSRVTSGFKSTFGGSSGRSSFGGGSRSFGGRR